MANIAAHERELFAPLLEALLADDRVTVYGPHDLEGRAPTVAFNVDGFSAAEVARALADRRSPSGTATTTRSRRCRASASTLPSAPASPSTRPDDVVAPDRCGAPPLNTHADAGSVSRVSTLAERLGHSRRRPPGDHLLRRPRVVPRRQRGRVPGDARRRRHVRVAHGAGAVGAARRRRVRRHRRHRRPPHAQRRARRLPLGSDHARPVAAVGRGWVPAQPRRPVGARRSRRRCSRECRPRSSGRSRGASTSPTSRPHLTAITLRPEFFDIYLELAHRVPAADPPAVDDHRGGGRLPVPPPRRRGGRGVPRPLRPRLARRFARAGAAGARSSSRRASPRSTCSRRSTRPRSGRSPTAPSSGSTISPS